VLAERADIMALFGYLAQADQSPRDSRLTALSLLASKNVDAYDFGKWYGGSLPPGYLPALRLAVIGKVPAND
jgi:hypothetical protein